MQAGGATPSPSRNAGAGLYRLASWLFARNAMRERVATRFHFDGSPEAIWNRIMLYEDVPRRPPFLLRTLLPNPIRTEGDKTPVGATVRCVYKGGDLIKQMTAVEPPHLLQFDVIAQNLGIESCMLSIGGSYQISAHNVATEVVLTTHYEAYLRPRFLWRPLEAHLAHELHRHIFSGICAAARPEDPAPDPVAVESLKPRYPPRGDIARMDSPACSRL